MEKPAKSAFRSTICGDKHSKFLQQADNHSPNYMIPELRSSGLLPSEYLQFLTDVSAQTIGPIFRSQESKKKNNSWPLKMGLIGCPETSVINYRHSPRNNPEEHSSHLLRGGSLKSHVTDTTSSKKSTSQKNYSSFYLSPVLFAYQEVKFVILE